MALPVFVNSVSATATAYGTTLTGAPCAAGDSVAVGDLLVLASWQIDNGFTSVVDSKGNTWTRARYQNYTGSPPVFASMDVWYCVVTVAMTASDTVTGTVAGSANKGWLIGHFTSVSASPFDQSISQFVSPGTTTEASGTTPATTQAQEVVLGIFGSYTAGGGVTVGVGAGYTLCGQAQWGPSNAVQVLMEYKTVSATGTQSATSTSSPASGQYHGFALTFKGATVALNNLTATDTGLTISDSLAPKRVRPRAFSDTGLTLTDSLVLTRLRARTLSETGLAFTEALAATYSPVGSGIAVSWVEVELPTIRGASVFSPTVSDTALAVSDSTGRVVTRVRSDTGATVSDSLAASRVRSLVLADTGLTCSDSLAVARVFGRSPFPDTGLVVVDAVVSVATHPRVLADTGLAFSDALARTYTPGTVLYSRTLADAGLASGYASTVLSDSPVAYWRLDEPSGTVAASKTNSPALDGTYQNTPTLGAAGAIADGDAAVTLDGSSEWIQVSPSALHSAISSAWTIEAWVNPVSDDASFTAVLTAQYQPSPIPFCLTYGGAAAGGIPGARSQAMGAALYSGGGWYSAYDPVDTPLNVWTHYVATFDGTTLSLYRNGSLVVTGPAAPASSTGGEVRIGRRWDSFGATDYFPGGLDEVALYGTALSAARVLAHYNAASAGISDSVVISTARLFSRTASDTGLAISDSLVRTATHPRAVADTGLTFSDALSRTAVHPRVATDTGATVADALARAATFARVAIDTGLTVSDSVVRTATHSRTLTDSGLAVNDAIALLIGRGRGIADVGAAISETLRSLRLRTATDTGLAVTDAAASSRVRALADTGSVVTDSLTRTATHPRTLADTGATVSDTLAATYTPGTAFYNWAVADTGATITDALAPVRLRALALTDAGATVTDSLARAAVHPRAATDTGLVFSESLARTAAFSRAAADTGLTVVGDAVARIATHPRALADTGLVAFSDSLSRQAGRALTDTGLTCSDAVARTAVHSRTATDQGVTVTDSLTRAALFPRAVADTGAVVADSLVRSAALVARTTADTGLTVTDALARTATHSRVAADTGLVVTDAVLRSTMTFGRQVADTVITFSDSILRTGVPPRTMADTGLVVADSLARGTTTQSRALADTGATVTDSLLRSLVRRLADTGSTVTDATASIRTRPLSDTGLLVIDATGDTRFRGLTDSGLVVTDSLARNQRVSRPLADIGVAFSDSLLRQAAGITYLADQGLTFSDSLARVGAVVARTVADTGLTLADSLVRSAASRARTATDTGLTVSDSLARTQSLGRALSDTGLVVTDSLLRIGAVVPRAFADTGLTLTDSLRRQQVGRALTDTGLSISDAAPITARHVLTDTGLAISDSLAGGKQYSRTVADAGLVLSDSLRRTALGRALADTAAQVTDSTAVTRLFKRDLTDSVSISDTVARVTGTVITVFDTAVTMTDSVALTRTRARQVADTGITVSDSLTYTRTTGATVFVTDIGVTVGDATRISVGRPLTDTGVSFSELLFRPTGFLSFLIDTGLTLSDRMAKGIGRVVFDTATTMVDSAEAVRSLDLSGPLTIQFDASGTTATLDPSATSAVPGVFTTTARAAVPGFTFTDDFNRPDGDIGNGWLSPAYPGEVPIQLVSGQASGAPGWASAYRPEVLPIEFEIEFDYISGLDTMDEGHNFYIYLQVDSFPAATGGYLMVMGTDGLIIQGTEGVVGPGSGPYGSTLATLADNTRIRIEINDVSFKVFYDDTLVLDVTASVSIPPGLFGLEMPPLALVDNFSITSPAIPAVPGRDFYGPAGTTAVIDDSDTSPTMDEGKTEVLVS